MLVLTRRLFESIVFQYGNERITLQIKEIKGGQVRLGIDASDSVIVVRSEVLDKNEISKTKAMRRKCHVVEV